MFPCISRGYWKYSTQPDYFAKLRKYLESQFDYKKKGRGQRLNKCNMFETQTHLQDVSCRFGRIILGQMQKND